MCEKTGSNRVNLALRLSLTVSLTDHLTGKHLSVTGSGETVAVVVMPDVTSCTADLKTLP